ncbi:MAG: M6 family metalloprotease domain-containing protein [Bacteroidaceae bacterium]|nr:M6 family metalloprotease domain-containing protein [Bacteroidaceae bacterium]
MKRKLFNQLSHRMFLLAALLLVTLAAAAVPAKPGLTRTITTADGTSVVATLVGDEHGHYWRGADGNVYLPDAATGLFRVADKQQLQAKAQTRRSRANSRRARRLAPRRVGEVNGIFGQKKGLIILVNFTDASFKKANNNALYQRIANEEGFSYGDFKGSMYDYFYAQSDGQFQLTFDVVGPVTVKNKYSYYGQNDSEGNDLRPATMVREALDLANSEVNYADYDWDGDGEVDQVYVVYAGKGEADGGAISTIWPHEWMLSEAQQYGDGQGKVKLDGVTIDTYACGPELDGLTGTIAGIGTMCHEFSHCLGYPDFYDTDYSGGQGMFTWDLMDMGSYNGDGFLPAAYTSYERWVAGWLTPIELSKTQAVTGMKPLTQGGQSYVIYNQGHPDEYFLLENRQQSGWDAGIPGAGLLILHVDYSASVWADNAPNDDPDRQRMTWIAADNKYQTTKKNGETYFTEAGAANDPFPYGKVNAFGRTTTPAATFYNKNIDGTKYLDSSVENITQNADGTISFQFRGASNIATPQFSPKAGRYAEPQLISITCATDGTTIYYTTDGTTPTTASTVFTEPFTVSETTVVKAIAVSTADGEESAVATANFTIGESGSDPSTKTFKRVTSTDDLLSGMRYVIACESEAKAASALNNNYLHPWEVTVDGDFITINDHVAVFILEGDQEQGWSFMNEKDKTYLYATEAKKLAESSNAYPWELTDQSGGVTMVFEGCGTMTYNVNSPRFTVYTSQPSKSMIRAHLFMESSEGVTPQPVQPLIVADETLTFATTVGQPQTLSFGVLSEGLTDDISLTLSDDNGVFALGATTIDKSASENGANVRITFTPTAAGTYTGTVTLTSAGAEDVTIALSATATDGSTPEPPVTDGACYELVTDAATLAAGNQVLIAYVDEEGVYALGTTQKTNNREATDDIVLNDDGTLTPGTGVQLITLEQEGTNFLFNVGDGYLYAASSDKNWLRTQDEVTDDCLAQINVDAEGVATIQFQGSNTRNQLRFNPNNGAPIFSCYASTSTVKAVPGIYRLVKADATPTAIAQTETGADRVAAVYNLAGQRVARLQGAAKTAPRLPKGLYILNGHKVAVR